MNDQRCEMRDDVDYELPEFLRRDEPQGAAGGQEAPNDSGKFTNRNASLQFWRFDE